MKTKKEEDVAAIENDLRGLGNCSIYQKKQSMLPDVYEGCPADWKSRPHLKHTTYTSFLHCFTSSSCLNSLISLPASLHSLPLIQF